MSISKNDPDRAKGATETEDHHESGNLSMENQLGHRDQDPLLKGADSDFPEPGGNPEHSGWAKKLRKVARKGKKPLTA